MALSSANTFIPTSLLKDDKCNKCDFIKKEADEWDEKTNTKHTFILVSMK